MESPTIDRKTVARNHIIDQIRYTMKRQRQGKPALLQINCSVSGAEIIMHGSQTIANRVGQDLLEESK